MISVRNILRILFLLALPLAVYSSGSASSLQGKVAEVVDGESIAVISQNHPVKVRLIGVAAPEKNQSFAGIARQHLSDLILDKYVFVRVSALRDGYLVGQVLLGDMDVCAQMIRDGVGWYNKSDESSLSEVERQVYQASQEAARSERRGLWQEDSPQAPWDVHRVQLATTNTSAVSLARQPATVVRGNQSRLSSEDLLGGIGGFLQPGSMANKPEVRRLSADGEQGGWLRYQPADRHFSILAPSDGVEVTSQVLGPQGQLQETHYVVGVNMSRRTIYFLICSKGSTGTSTDASAASDAINGLVGGMNSAAQQHGEAPAIVTPGRNISVNGYTGRQYSLTTNAGSGVLRVLSKQIGAEREVFMLGVLIPPGSPSSGDEFLNSFRVK
jgi:endonuclease YncB( thermonuclease family)